MSWKVILYNLFYFFAVVDTIMVVVVTVVVDDSVVAGRLEHLFCETFMFISRILICTVIVGTIAILLFKCFIPFHELIFTCYFSHLQM